MVKQERIALTRNLMSEILIPYDAVFVLGDNRPRSVDSRMNNFGPVPIKNLIGVMLEKISAL